MGKPKRNAEFLRFMLAAALLSAVAGWSHASAAEQRVALVIGNSAYPSAPLRNPVNDAKAMADKLRSLGFNVMLRTNATQKDMNRAVVQFGQQLAAGSVGLFYYAGHGLQVRGKNFLLPVDAEIDSEASVRSESVDVDQVLDQFSASRLSMVILDACRNNPFERRFRAGQGGGLAQIDAPKGTLIAYSTAPGKTAADGTGANGVYTEQLLRAMDAPGLKVEDVFKQVRINVARATQDQQIPWEASSLTGEFFFRVPIEKPALAAPAAAPVPQVDPATFEMAFWDSIKASANPADFEAYLEQYPKGRFAALARNRIKSADQPTQIAAVQSQAAAKAEAKAAAEWVPRIAMLEKSRGHLTFSKAIAILLNVNSAEELTLLLTTEGKVKRMQWHHAYAMGIDNKGNFIWGGGYNMRNTADATETAHEFCKRAAGDSCKVVFVNGEFREKDFLEMAQRLGGQDVEAVRRAYVKSLTRNPTEFTVGSTTAGSGTVMPSMGFASVRE